MLLEYKKMNISKPVNIIVFVKQCLLCSRKVVTRRKSDKSTGAMQNVKLLSLCFDSS